MAELIKLEIADDIVIPPEGFAQVFYTEEYGYIVKKAKLSDGTVVTIAEE